MASQNIASSPFITSTQSSPAEDCSMVMLSVDGHTFAVTKALLIEASPVFSAMFSHDTKESASNHIEVVDFNASTVAAVVACLNGHMPTTATAEEIIEMLWFADKYFMEAVTAELEAVLIKMVSVDTLFAITRYASTQSRHRLLSACVHCYCMTPDDLDFGPEDYEAKQMLIEGMLSVVVGFFDLMNDLFK